MNDVAIGLTLDDGQYRSGMAGARKELQELDKAPLKNTKNAARDVHGRFVALEKQIVRTEKRMSGLARVAAGLKKASGIAATVGLGLELGGGAASLAGWAMKKSATRGKVPPIPGSPEAARQSSRLARASSFSAVGGKMRAAGNVAGMASLSLGLGGGIAGLLAGSRGAAGGVGELNPQLVALSSNAQRASGSSGGLGKVLGGLPGPLKAVGFLAGMSATAILGMGAGVTALATSGLSMNSSLEQSKAQFEVFTGSATKADAIIDGLKKRADVTPFETKEYIEGGTALMSAAEGSKDKLMELMKTSEMLTVLNPAQGLTGAALAIKNALAGDYVSLQDRFNINPKTIQKYKDMGLTGQEMIRAVLKSMNVTEQSVDKLGSTFSARKSTVTSFVDNIRTSLSAGLFGLISEKMGGMIAWITKNQAWIMDTASGLGTMLAEVISGAAARISGLWSSMQMIGFTAFEFLKGLPSRLVSMFNDGTLAQGAMALIGGVAMVAWDAVKLVGKLLVAGVWNGLPSLALGVVKFIIDAVRGAVGDKVAGMLGLDKASEHVKKMGKAEGTAFAEKSKAAFAEFGTNAKANMAGLGLVGGDIMGQLGLGDARKKASDRVAGGGVAGGMFAQGGVLHQAYTIGQQQRMAREAKIAQEQWKKTGPQGPAPVDPKLAQIAENQNAKGQMRKARNFKAEQQFRQKQEIELRVTSADGGISPLSA